MSTTETQPDLQQLQADFHRAVDAWRNPDFGGWLELWLGPECALLKYARAIGCEFGDADDCEKLRLLEKETDHHECAGYFHDVEAPHNQAALLMEGLVNGVLAVQSGPWKDGESLSQEFVEHAGRCFKAYQQAWPITTDPAEPAANVFTQPFISADPARHVLYRLAGDSRFAPFSEYLTRATWLTVRRLWDYLLDEKLERTDATTDGAGDVGDVLESEASVLFVIPGSNQGQVGPLTIRRAAEGQFACYLDPVALGQTVVDGTMIQSIQLAWLLCRAGLTERLSDATASPPSLRLSPHLKELGQIEGGSAGGLFACGMYAAANGIALNTDATASFVLKPPAGHSRDPKPEEITVGPVAGGAALQAKIDAAADNELRHVILEEKQSKSEFKAKPGLLVHGVNNLKDALDLLTGDARIERVLEEYCRQKVERWERARNDPGDRDHLQYYVPPHYAMLNAGETPEDSSQQVSTGEEDDSRQSRIIRVTGDNEETVLTNLMRAGRRLCITEDAGAGKSVFTRRVEAFISSSIGQSEFYNGKPCLAVRWEQRVQNWPESFWRNDLIESLAEALRPSCEAVPSQDAEIDLDEWCRQVAAWALDEGRVVLILDAMDQVTGNESTDSLQQFLHHQNENSPEAKRCRVILTSRAYRVADKQQLFSETSGWQFGIIEGFDEEQQEGYLQRSCGAGLDDLFPSGETRKSLRELLKIPVVLDMVGQLAGTGQLRPFDSRGSLYLQATDYFIDRAARKLGLEPKARQRIRWKTILAATAFEMMSRELYNYAVEGDANVYDVQEGASRRLNKPVSDEEWEQISQVSDLTDRCILEGADREMLGWKHRGMMEFYAGMHLARNSQADWVDSSTPIRCGDPAVRKFAADANWYWAFRFAIELDPEVRQPEILSASLAQLFEPPDSDRRPTELMLRAWQMMRRTELYFQEQILAEYRRQFLDILAGEDLQRARLAAEVLHQDDLIEHVNSGRTGQWTLQDLQPLQPPYVYCSNSEDGRYLTFWMGTDSEVDYADDDERPRHRVRIQAINMASCTVTRAQYRLFDQNHPLDSPQLLSIAPEEDCPAWYTTWFDAFCFALWIGNGYRLPSETEWEGAARGGRDDLSDLIGVPPYNATFTRNNVNFNGFYEGDPRDGMASRPMISVRTDKTRRVQATQRAFAGTIPSAFEPNAFGIWHAHGNVREWCHDEYNKDLYRRRVELVFVGLAREKGSVDDLTEDDWRIAEQNGLIDAQRTDALSSSLSNWRVVRGGGVDDFGCKCRAASRDSLDPGNHIQPAGIRLCLEIGTSID